MALTAFSQLVTKNIHRTSIGPQVQTALALERARNVLHALLDEETDRAVRPAYIRYNALTLRCRHSSAAACIGPFEQEILDYVNKGFPAPVAKRLHVIFDTNETY
ncbi:DUF721 domain-containing protein [Candidatus Uhrbacteria bacterium]|nr:DUF721 domain-containing protein [Candidatus Uhrbacteria bacterium]